jgi:hypothetical protein
MTQMKNHPRKTKRTQNVAQSPSAVVNYPGPKGRPHHYHILQNKPKYPRFQSKNNDYQKNKANSTGIPDSHPERSEGSLCAKRTQIGLALMKKQNEPKTCRVVAKQRRMQNKPKFQRRPSVPAWLSFTPARRDVQTFSFLVRHSLSATADPICLFTFRQNKAN